MFFKAIYYYVCSKIAFPFASYHGQLFITKEFQIPGNPPRMLFSSLSLIPVSRKTAGRRQQRLAARAGQRPCSAQWLAAGFILLSLQKRDATVL